MKRDPLPLFRNQLELAPAGVSPSAPGARPAPGLRRSNTWLLFAGGTDDSGNDELPTITVGRRRRSDQPGPGGRERAEAPERHREDQPQPKPVSNLGLGSGGSSGGSGSSGGGFGGFSSGASGGSGSSLPKLPGGLKLSPLMLLLLVVLFGCCLVGAFLMFNRGGSQQAVQQIEPTSVEIAPTEVFLPSPTRVPPTVMAVEPTATVAPIRTRKPSAAPATATPKPAAPAASSSSPSGDKWTVILYQDADDKILDTDIFIDLNEAERAGSDDNVKIVTLADRYRSGGWTTAKAFYLTQDNDLTRVRAQQLGDLGEVNMSDPKTLIAFVTWAIKNYPADKYALVLSDHGMGWPGGWSDANTGTQKANTHPSIPLSQAVGNDMYLMDIDDALSQIRSQSGLDKFELIGMDACLMSDLEVLDVLAQHGRYAVASQETEPALGWAYTSFLNTLKKNPGMNGGELSKAIVESYIVDDERIVDDQARTDWVGRGSGIFGSSLPSAEQLTQQMGQDITLTAVDLSQIPTVMDSVNRLAYQLQGARQQDVAKARSYAQMFTSVFGSDVPPSYMDLGHFSYLLKRINAGAQVNQAADGVLSALGQAIIAEKHGPGKPGATGISIYYPNSQLYRTPVAGLQSYTAIAKRFAADSQWDEFLAFHYTGRQFKEAERTLPAPDPNSRVQIPGAGKLTLSTIRKSGDVAAPGKPVTLKTDISGQNLGYVYFFTGYYDKASNSIFVADQDYLESSKTQEVNGVYYPEWGTDKFTLQFAWEPLMYALTDGKNQVNVALAPQNYGRKAKDAVYTADGTYTFADSGESQHARLYFRDGTLQQVYGFTGTTATGAPHAITPAAGDKFTVEETWLDLDQSSNVSKVSKQAGGTLTFGSAPFEWVELDAAVGDYLVGFIAEDLDGAKTAVYTNVTVR